MNDPRRLVWIEEGEWLVLDTNAYDYDISLDQFRSKETHRSAYLAF